MGIDFGILEIGIFSHDDSTVLAHNLPDLPDSPVASSAQKVDSVSKDASKNTPKPVSDAEIEQLFENMRGMKIKEKKAEVKEEYTEEKGDKSLVEKTFRDTLRAYSSLMRGSGGCGEIAFGMLENYRGRLEKLAQDQPQLQHMVPPKLPSHAPAHSNAKPSSKPPAKTKVKKEKVQIRLRYQILTSNPFDELQEEE